LLNVDVQRIHADAHPWLFKQPGPETFTPPDAAALLAKPGHLAFLAFVDDAPVGYAVAELIRHPESGRHHAHSMVYLHQVSVRPAARRTGVGRALLNAVRDAGRANGIELLALDAWTFNEQALAFFRSYGLVPYNVRLWNKID
jgi:GNAT superfamily N-acetyltransferase